jgi:hypothetical protein
MGSIPDKILTWQMVQPTTFNRETKESTPGKIEKTQIPVPDFTRFKAGRGPGGGRELWCVSHRLGVLL